MSSFLCFKDAGFGRKASSARLHKIYFLSKIWGSLDLWKGCFSCERIG